MSARIPKNFIPDPFGYHQEIELHIESLTNLGIGLGRMDDWVVMVPFALPGEHIRARVFRNRSNYSEADLIEVMEASPDRAEPFCKLYGQCGGCQYQHLRYEAELEWKRQQVADCLLRIGAIEYDVPMPVGSPRQTHYRSKLTPHYPKRTPGQFPIGFHHVGTRSRMVDVPECPIATEAINEALPQARKRVHQSRGKKGGTLLLRHTLEGVTSDHSALVSEKLGNLVLSFNAGDFFQNNPFALPALVDYVVTQASAVQVRNLVDAYCGSGLFALSAAKHFERVAGVEISQRSIQWATANAAANNIPNATFISGRAEAIFDGLTYNGSETAMIIDPPRAGCDTLFIEQLVAFAPQRLVYVSCDPSTQARDLKHLLENGYILKAIQPFDLFPRTRHIENVAVLDRAYSKTF